MLPQLARTATKNGNQPEYVAFRLSCSPEKKVLAIREPLNGPKLTHHFLRERNVVECARIDRKQMESFYIYERNMFAVGRNPVAKIAVFWRIVS